MFDRQWHSCVLDVHHLVEINVLWAVCQIAELRVWKLLRAAASRHEEACPGGRPREGRQSGS